MKICNYLYPFISERTYRFRSFLTCVVFFAFAVSVKGQYQNVPCTGYNTDVVLNGSNTALTSVTGNTATVDNVPGGYWLAASDWNYTGACAPLTNFMPVSGTVPANSTVANGLVYTLQSYSGLNDLRVPATGSGTTGSGVLTVVTPVQAGNLYLLYTGGGSIISAGITVTVTFTDATTQVFSGLTALDWFTGTNAAIGNLGRIQSTVVTCATTTTGGPFLYDMSLALSAGNYSKFVQSITVQKTITAGIMNVFAVGMLPPCSTPAFQPTALNFTPGINQITGSFTAAAGTPGAYMVVRYPSGSAVTAPAATGTTYTVGQALGLGTIIQLSNATTFTTTGLTPGTTYDFYVYSYNGPCLPAGQSFSILNTSPLSGSASTNACGSLSGIVPVGPGLPNTPAGGFTSLTNALAYLNLNGIGGNTIFELQSGYNGTSANETFPITFPVNSCINSSKTITVRPASGVTGLSITSNSSVATIDFNGSTYITFDGRPGGTGGAIAVPNTTYLSIINTNASGVAVRMINEAQNNTVTYCDVQGQNGVAAANPASTLSGVIYFAGTTGANGNDNNTISNCNVHSTSSSTWPAQGIVSNGTTTTAATYNDNCTISGNNIYDYFLATGATAGVNISVGNTAWTISNNSVFQTATRTFTTAANQRGFWVTPNGGTLSPQASGFIITGNYIGGGAPNCGGSALTILGALANVFLGMDISTGNGTATSVQGNTIQNIALTTTSTASGNFTGIVQAAGNNNIGTTSANLIGSASSASSILVTENTSSGGTATGIRITGGTTVTNNVANNIICGIATQTGAITISCNIIGILVSGGVTVNVTGNTIGSTTLANAINATQVVGTTIVQSVTGISVTGGTTVTVNNNTIANMNNAANNATITTSSLMRGITNTSAAVTNMDGNTVFNLSSAAPNTGSGSASAIVGISNTGTFVGMSVSGNTIYGLKATNTSTTNATQITGLYWQGATSGTNLLNRNFIYNLGFTSADPAAVITGIDCGTSGLGTFTNNMVRLGYDYAGAPIATAMAIRGIQKGGSTANIWYNSVYIGGAGVGTNVNNTAAMNITTVVAADNVVDNIFDNVRQNASTGGSHYSINVASATALAALNYNLYQYAGVNGSLFALNNAVPVAAYSAGWRTGDVNSVTGDPQFIDPTGVTPNLHLSTSIATAAEGSGTLTAGTVLNDFDSQSRGSLTPVDIGADAGNFIGAIPSCTTVSLNAGTATASNVTACTVSLSLSGNTAGVYGLSYQWQSRTPAGAGAFSNISGATFPTLSTGLPGATADFQCVVSCSGGGSATSTIVSVTGASPGMAMGYSPLIVTGYNHDVIANGNTGTTNPPINTTTAPVDGTGSNYYFYDASYSYNGSTFPATSLPVNGKVVSSSVTGLLYQLQAATGSNVLQLRGGGGVGTTLTGTLALTTPQNGAAVYLLATSGNGASTITATVNFTDATTQVFTGISVPDWFNVSPFSQGGFGRVNATGFDASAPGGNNPRMYDVTLALSPSNYLKNVQSITITNTTAGATAGAFITNIFAVTMAVSSPTPFCGGLATSVTLFNPPAGATYQWQSSSVSGGPYTNVTGGSGATSTTYTNASLTGPQYYVCNITCPGGYSTLSTEVFENINPVPTVTVSPTSSTFCSGGSGVTLTANGAATYAWSPTAGLSGTGQIVVASPTATTVYTVTGVNSGGCSNTATTTVNFAVGPTVSTTATPASVCSGGSSALAATATLPSSASNYTFTASSGTFNALSGGTVVAGLNADEVISAAVPIGFSFNFNGTSYNSVYVSTNGYLSFNPSAINSLTNNISTSAATMYPLLAPLWDDLDGATAGTASYQTSGSVGSRVFTFEWLNWEWYYLANTSVISFQCKLYESDKHIEFVYRQEAGAVVSASASIGIASASGAYLSLNGTGTSPAASSSTETTSLATKPATGQVYSFSPPVASGLTYTWSPGTFLNTTSGATVTASGVTATTTYTVSVSNAGCTNTSTVTLTQAALNVGATSTLASGNGCSGSTTYQLQATATGGGQPYSYSWSPTAGLSSSTIANPVANPLTTTVYTVTVSDICAVGTATGTVTVTIVGSPSISNSMSASCSTGDVLTANGTPPVGVSWYWQSSATATSTALNATTPLTVNSNGTYYVRAFSTAANCWASADSIVVNNFVLPSTPPTPVAGSNPACNGGTTLTMPAPPPGVIYYWQTSATGTSTAQDASTPLSVTATGTYYVRALEATGGCWSNASSILITVYQSISGSFSTSQISSCGTAGGTINVLATGTGTVFANDFTSSVLNPAQATVYGSASVTGGQLVITPNSSSQSGAIQILNTTGITSNDFQIDYDMITQGPAGGVGPADGFSYSYGDDVVPIPTNTGDGATTCAPENGSGTKLKFSFDAINNTGGCPANTGNGNLAGIYFMYNCTTIHQGSTCPGVLNFDPSTWWRATSVQPATPLNVTHVTIQMSNAGTATLTLTGTSGLATGQTFGPTVYTLPASYITADKTSWKHVFCGRTGGGWEGQYIDNLTIQYLNIYEYSIDNVNWQQSSSFNVAPGTYPVYVRYVQNTTCPTFLGNAIINPPPTSFASSSTAASVCPGASFTLTFSPAYTSGTYQWESSTNGGASWTPIPGATNASLTSTQSAATMYHCLISCAATGLNATSTSVTVAQNPFMDCYCSSAPTSTIDEEIYSVTVNGNSTPAAYAGTNGCSTPAPGPGSVLSLYSNFKTLAPLSTLLMGTAVPFSIQEDECDGATYFSNGCAIWVDFNHNGSFADAGEQVFVEANTALGPRTISGTITVPATALPGVTAMRIIDAENFSGASLTPCMTYTYGETEDWLVSIAAPNATSNSPRCEDDTLKLFTPATGTSYSWVGPNAYTSTAANPVILHATPAMSGIYTVTITFPGGSTVDASVTVVVNPTPAASASSDLPFCEGTQDLHLFTTAPTAVSYAWNGPGGYTSGVANPVRTTTTASMSGAYTVTVTDANSCTNSDVANVTVHALPPVAITPIGSLNICTGQTSTDLQGTGVPLNGYSWSTSETTDLITVNTAGTWILTGTDANGCVNTDQVTTTASAAPAAPIVTPAGPVNLCSSDGGFTYTSTSLCVSNYSSNLSWSTGETITCITVDYGDIFNVTYTDPSGCFSVSNAVTTNAYLASADPTGASSNAFNNNICLGNNITLSVVGGSLGDGADWHWYESTCGGTARGTGPSITLTPSTAGLHHYFVRAEGPCNPTGTACAPIDVTVSTAPPSGTSHFTVSAGSGCNSTIASFSTNAVTGATYYSWSGTAGALYSINSVGPFQAGPYTTVSPNVYVQFATPPPAGGSGYNICSFAGNACGQSNTICTWVRAKVTQPGTIVGSIMACAGTNVMYSVPAVVGADTYTWTITGNATINGGGTTLTTSSNSITVNFLGTWTSGTLSVYASMNCGFNSAVRNVTLSNTPAIPGTMAGPSYVCPSNSATFSVPAVAGAASYNWTCSVAGAVLTPSANSCSILFPAVIPGGSTVCVAAVSPCGGASATRCKGIANGIPNTPGAISGPATGQCGQTGVSYSITPIGGATGYSWTANNGATISGPSNLSGVSINFPGTFTTCTLTVVALNSCGTSVARTLVVSGAPAQPGVISGNQSVCVGATETYSTTGSSGATSFNWTVPSGASILGPANGSSILVQWGATGGNVSVTATNGCGTSTARNLAVAVTCRQSQVSETMGANATLYPNPTNGKTTVKFESSNSAKYVISVVDVTGRIIISDEVTAAEGINMHELDLSKVAKGMYLVRMETTGGEMQLLKVTVE